MKGEQKKSECRRGEKDLVGAGQQETDGLEQAVSQRYQKMTPPGFRDKEKGRTYPRNAVTPSTTMSRPSARLAAAGIRKRDSDAVPA